MSLHTRFIEIGWKLDKRPMKILLANPEPSTQAPMWRRLRDACYSAAVSGIVLQNSSAAG
jgi:hypothetical protein